MYSNFMTIVNHYIFTWSLICEFVIVGLFSGCMCCHSDFISHWLSCKFYKCKYMYFARMIEFARDYIANIRENKIIAKKSEQIVHNIFEIQINMDCQGIGLWLGLYLSP